MTSCVSLSSLSEYASCDWIGRSRTPPNSCGSGNCADDNGPLARGAGLRIQPGQQRLLLHGEFGDLGQTERRKCEVRRVRGHRTAEERRADGAAAHALARSQRVLEPTHVHLELT